jgi:hypothetical protein
MSISCTFYPGLRPNGELNSHPKRAELDDFGTRIQMSVPTGDKLLRWYISLCKTWPDPPIPDIQYLD